jgi:hypothetical protein
MNDSNGYAVFFFPQALEALGEAIKPYLQTDGAAGPHVICNEIDTGGALIEMTLRGRTQDDRDTSLELMVPSGMVRMVVSTHSDELFGFRQALERATPVASAPIATPGSLRQDAPAGAPASMPETKPDAEPATPAA